MIAPVETSDWLANKLRFYLKMKAQIWQAKDLSDQLSELNGQLYDRNLLVEKELYGARQLQQSLLPLSLADDKSSKNSSDLQGSEGLSPNMDVFQLSKLHLNSETLRISGLYLPCDALGGDLYDLITFADGSVGVTVADVSGHGVPAGFITALFKSSFYRITHLHQTPDKVLFYLNNELAEIVKTGDYVTGLYCRFLNEGRSIQLGGAGHPYPLLYRAETGAIERLAENGTPLVWIPDMEYGMLEADLQPGDKLLLFTDGITEMMNIHGDMFGEDALERLFKSTIEAKPDISLLDAMIQHLSDFTEGQALGDDLSMVLIEIKAT